MNAKISIGERIKELRQKQGLTQEQLATAISVDKSTIAKYETDDREPKVNVLCNIADYFDVSLDFLAGRKDI